MSTQHDVPVSQSLPDEHAATLGMYLPLMMERARGVPVERLGQGDDPEADRALVESVKRLEKDLRHVLGTVVGPWAYRYKRELAAELLGVKLGETMDTEVEILARWMHYGSQHVESATG